MPAISDDAVAAAAEIVGAHDALVSTSRAKAKIGDVAAEWARICSAMRALDAALEAEGSSADSVVALRAHAARYMAGYEFSRELGLIEDTYAGDPERIRSIALKIAESLADKGLIGELRGITDG